MEKRLPGVFANKIEKNLSNNDEVFYSAKNVNKEIVQEKTRKGIVQKNIHQKIKDIFSSERYVYKANVDITTKSGKTSKKIIGQNKTHLITIENELIPITEIVDIDFSK